MQKCEVRNAADTEKADLAAVLSTPASVFINSTVRSRTDYSHDGDIGLTFAFVERSNTYADNCACLLFSCEWMYAVHHPLWPFKPGFGGLGGSYCCGQHIIGVAVLDASVRVQSWLDARRPPCNIRISAEMRCIPLSQLTYRQWFAAFSDMFSVYVHGFAPIPDDVPCRLLFG